MSHVAAAVASHVAPHAAATGSASLAVGAVAGPVVVAATPEASSSVGLGVWAVAGDVSALTTGIALPGLHISGLFGAFTRDVSDLAALVAALLRWGLDGLGAIPDQMSGLLAVVARASTTAPTESATSTAASIAATSESTSIAAAAATTIEAAALRATFPGEVAGFSALVAFCVTHVGILFRFVGNFW